MLFRKPQSALKRKSLIGLLRLIAVAAAAPLFIAGPSAASPAVFEVREVAEEAMQAGLAADALPEGVVAALYHPEVAPDRAERWIAVRDSARITGDHLAGADVSVDAFGVPGVGLRFNAEGARRFADLTREAVGRRVAILVDGEVLSAPFIRAPILHGQAIITGGFTAESAQALAARLTGGAAQP